MAYGCRLHGIRLQAAELLCRIARFHALMELAFCTASRAHGFSSVQNREMLCAAST